MHFPDNRVESIDIKNNGRAGDDLHKKIQDLAYARFQYEKPVLQFSTEELELEIQPEENYRGSFSMTSINGIAMRGVVYSTNPRMECLTREFEGTDVTIPYEFHSEGLMEDDIQKGDFTIICNGGEYSLPFRVSVSQFFIQSSVGRIKNLFDFANLAQVSMEEAFRIFQAPCFRKLMKESERKERLLYRAVGGQKAQMQGMEEFLIGIRKKQRVTFSIEEADKEFQSVSEDVCGIIRLKKEQWGYLELFIASDSGAVVPVKNRITTVDFIGNFVEIEFIVQAEQLHSGKNYVRITVESLNQREICEICIRKEGDIESEKRKEWTDRREKKKLWKRLTRLYLDFRMQRIVTGVWSKESCACLERLKELEPDNLWYGLYQAQTLLINKQRQEAEWILDDFRKGTEEKDSPLYAFYLYLTTLQETEVSYATKIFRQIQEIYQKNQEDMRLFLMMLFLDPQMNQSTSRKLSAIEEKIAEGMYSPILYMEAYYLIKNDVYLLQKMGDFERYVLHWAAKEGEITAAVAKQMTQCASQIRQYHSVWYEILEACYQANQDKEMLQTICGFCIKWNLFSGKYFVWYDKGIQEELRLAGLYEAWLESADPEQIEQFPKTVMLYFQYKSNLNYKKQALLYASIIKKKADLRSVYEAYEKHIEHFAMEQLLLQHIDENLAVLYEELLKKYAVNHEISKALVKTLYTYKLVCEDDRMARVVVVHDELEREQAVPIIRGQAYIQLYSDSYCILMENDRGIRYIPTESLDVKPLMLKERYAEACVAAGNDELFHLVHYFVGRKTAHTFRAEDMPRLLKLMESELICQEYKHELKPQMIEYYYDFYTGTTLDDYLKQVDYDGLKQIPRNKLMKLMIARGIYDRAYEMLGTFGCEQASGSELLLVVSQKLNEQEYEKDDMLLGICRAIFHKGKYNESVLKYLCKYFQGSVREMESLWRAAREFEIDTYELEERFLVQLLYTEGYTEHMEDIFQSYFETKGQEMLILAYLSYFSYQYFVKNMVISDKLFQCLQQQLFLKNALNDSCKLACFKWLTEQQSRSEQQDELLKTLLSEYLKRKMYFAFYQELPSELLVKYHLYDRIFLEYRTNPAWKVRVSVGQDVANNQETENCQDAGNNQEAENYQEEEMKQMYEGIFVKPFVVFFGEKIPYYIKEERPEGEVITESGHISTNDLMTQVDASSYDMINDMMISYQLNDNETLRELYVQYQELEQLVEKSFGLL